MLPPSPPMAASGITLPSCPPVVPAPGLGGTRRAEHRCPRFRVTWGHPRGPPPATPQGASPEHQQEAARPPPPKLAAPPPQTHPGAAPHRRPPAAHPSPARPGQTLPGPDERLHVPPPVSPQIRTPGKAQSGPQSLCTGLRFRPESEALGESPAVPSAGWEAPSPTWADDLSRGQVLGPRGESLPPPVGTEVGVRTTDLHRHQTDL